MLPATKNGNRWMIVLLVGIAVPVLGAGFAWINGRHETDMAHLLDHRAEDTSAVRAVSDRTIKLESDMLHLKADVTEIKDDVKLILRRMPG